MHQSSQLTLQQAHAILVEFNCLQPKPIQTESEQTQVQTALLRLADGSDYQIFGVLADSFEQGLLVLKSYADALGYSVPEKFQSVAGPVYLKFNPHSGLCHTDRYSDELRGVLVSYQSDDESQINQIYGHLPLDLWMPPAH